MERINKLVIDSTAALSDLCEFATEFPTDKSPYHFSAANNHRHAYTAVYDFLFAQRRFEPLIVGEIGILDNNSMNAWRAYFPNARLFGFEFSPDRIDSAKRQRLPAAQYAQIDVSSRESIFDALNAASVTFDVLIDDSTHLFDHQINVVGVGLNFLRPGGVLVVEDVFRNWDESRYRDALRPYYQYFSSGYLVETNHDYASSEGNMEPYYNNDKLLVLFRNTSAVRREHPSRDLNRTLLSRALTEGKIEVTELAAPLVVSPPCRYEDGVAGARGYVVTHLNCKPIERPEFTTVYCGSAAAGRPTGAISDILRDGTRLINRRWSELSAMYRIWQDGPRSDVVGFNHYRRYLSFSLDHDEPMVTIARDDIRVVENACYDSEVISRVGQNYCIVAKPQRLGGRVPDTYASWHIGSDYELMRRLAVERYPHLAAEFDQQLVRDDMYACNLFFLCWADFDDLCKVWFSVLGDFCSEVKWPRGDLYQNRDVAFLSEGLFDVWVRTKQKAGLELDERTTILIQ
ncbi:DUF4422 domain-containing protein [Rhodopila globiformis]|uniref:DUF4422 domain-containing protein n=1 Tax=Rhodopila globiformis TaxID=1071 RepID=A0A2S6NNN7_RHOGL|nr:DUF4422 domain-containing protein [Rhodopila globiformis]PPQ39237.1 hypothetical protein CCS01_01585 [Rhodopila globiformis]